MSRIQEDRSANLAARERAMQAFAEAQADFDRLHRVIRQEFETAAGAATCGIMPTSLVANARRTIECAMNQLPIAIGRYEETLPADLGGFVNRIVAFDAGTGSNGSPTLQPKSLMLVISRAAASFGVTEMSSEYTQHALVRWLERSGYDALDFLGDLVEAEFLTFAMINALNGDGLAHEVICPLGGGALLGLAHPYPFRDPVVGYFEAIGAGGRRHQKVRISGEGAQRNKVAPTRIVWKTFIGEDELRPRQIAAVEEIERTVQPGRKALKAMQSEKLGLDAKGKPSNQEEIARNKAAAEATALQLRELILRRAWALPENRASAATTRAAA